MKNNILNELRTPVFLVNKYNVITYINEIGEDSLVLVHLY